MQVSRLHMTVPLAILATLALMLAAVAPVLAAPSGTTGSRPVLADHVTDCNLTVDGSGELTFEGDVLAGAELAAVDALLAANADLAAAIDLAAEADVDACINLELLVDGEVITANIDADISVCSATVTINGDGSVDIGDANVDAELLDARLIAALQLAADAAADADTEACVVVTVTDNDVDADVEVDAVVTLCATLIIDANGDATINGDLIDADQFIDSSSETDFTAEVEVGVRITATVEVDDDIFVLVEAFDLEGCGDAGATPTPTPDGGTGAGEMVTVSIMKHLCDDVTTVAEFEAVENAGAGGEDGGFGTAPGLVATVIACPTIVLTGDVPTPGANTTGEVDFDFEVVDADGTQILSSDGDFVQQALCEDKVMVDVDEDGELEADVCLDTSMYRFEVVDGTVVISETEVPEGSTGLGTIRFTPGSEDETALATSIDVVEATGVITLDTSMASATALEEGIVIHAYNFAEVAGAPAPTATATPAASELPDAAVDGTGTAGGNGFAILFGIMALASISFLGYRTVAARRTR